MAVWAGIQLIASLALGGSIVVMAGPAFMRLMDLRAVAALGLGAVAAMFQRLAPTYGLLLVYGLALNALLYAAMNRAVLRPADDRFGYFRLGADELRQFGLLLLSLVVFTGVYFVAILVAVALAVIVSLVLKPVAFLVAVLATLGTVCAAVFVLVRLSLASALTFATRRVNLFGSWALTRGRFWTLFGVYVLALAFVCVVLALGFVVSFTRRRPSSAAVAPSPGSCASDLGLAGGHVDAGRWWRGWW